MTTRNWNRFDYSAENCSIGRTMQVVGEKWSVLLLREIAFGLSKFSEFEAALGCARNILSERLSGLVAHGVLARHEYRDEGKRRRFEYKLTEKGWDLLPVLVAMMQWGDKWTAGRSGPAIELRHRGCGCRVGVSLHSGCRNPALTHDEIRVKPGPGAIKIGVGQT